MEIKIPLLKILTKNPERMKNMEEIQALGELIEERGHKVTLRYKLGNCHGEKFVLVVAVRNNRPCIVEKSGNDFLCSYPIPGIPVRLIKDNRFRFKISI